MDDGYLRKDREVLSGSIFAFPVAIVRRLRLKVLVGT